MADLDCKEEGEEQEECELRLRVSTLEWNVHVDCCKSLYMSDLPLHVQHLHLHLHGGLGRTCTTCTLSSRCWWPGRTRLR